MENFFPFFKFFRSLLLTIPGLTISVLPVHFLRINIETEIPSIFLSLVLFFISKYIRHHLYRVNVLYEFTLFSENTIIGDITIFFRDLYQAINFPETMVNDVYSFKQQTLTNFYKQPLQKNIWKYFQIASREKMLLC